MFFWLARRRLRRSWPILLALLVTAWLTANLVALPPLRIASIRQQELAEVLASATVPQRSLLLAGLVDVQQAVGLEQELGSLLQQRVTLRQLAIPAWLQIFHPDGLETLPQFTGLVLHIWNIEPLEDHVTLLAGRWPHPVTKDPIGSSEPITQIEVAMGDGVAESLNLAPGDVLTTGFGRFDLLVTGIVAARDPGADVWWGDRQGLLFTGWRRLGQDPDVDELTIGLMTPRTTFEEFISPRSEWRFVLSPAALVAQDPVTLRDAVASWQARFSNDQQRTSTGLLAILDALAISTQRARDITLLLILPAVITGLVLLGLAAGRQVSRWYAELAIWQMRGFSFRQLWLLLVLESGAVLLLAFALTLLTIAGAQRAWAVVASLPAAPAASSRAALAGTSWETALLVIMGCWLVTAIASLSGRHSLHHWLAGPSRDLALGRPRLLGIGGLVLLIFGTIAYRQALQAGQADALLLLSTAIINFGAAVYWAILFPWLASLAYRLASRSRATWLPLGLARTSRLPAITTPAVFCLTLALGFGSSAWWLSRWGGAIPGWEEPLLVMRQVRLALTLNLIIFSVLGLGSFLVLALSAGRGSPFTQSILVALGFSRPQRAAMSAVTAATILGISVLGGLVLGNALALLTLPLLQAMLAA